MVRHRLLKTKDVAEWIGIPEATLVTWRCRPPENVQPLPFVPMGRHVRYREDQVQKWIEANTVTPEDTLDLTIAKFRRDAE